MFPWLSFNADKNSLKVDKDSTTLLDVGEWKIVVRLTDEAGASAIYTFVILIIDDGSGLSDEEQVEIQ